VSLVYVAVMIEASDSSRDPASAPAPTKTGSSYGLRAM
jgi:hypothetical protein